MDRKTLLGGILVFLLAIAGWFLFLNDDDPASPPTADEAEESETKHGAARDVEIRFSDGTVIKDECDDLPVSDPNPDPFVIATAEDLSRCTRNGHNLDDTSSPAAAIASIQKSFGHKGDRNAHEFEIETLVRYYSRLMSSAEAAGVKEFADDPTPEGEIARMIMSSRER